MRFRSSELAFYLVCAAAFLPWLSAVTGATAITHGFDAVVVLASGAVLAFNREAKLKFGLPAHLFFLSWGFYYLFILALGKQIASIGLLSVVVLTFSFAVLLNIESVTGGALLRQLRSIYVLHIAFIVIESLAIFGGYGDIFVNLGGDQYRQSGAALAGHIGVEVEFVPNSLFVQLQATAHLVMTSFLFAYLQLARSNQLRISLLLLFLLALFFLVINNTTFVIFAVLLCAIWLIRAKVTQKLITILIALVAVSAYFYDVIISILFYKFYSGYLGSTGFFVEYFDFYLQEFSDPVVRFQRLGLLEQLFGTGRLQPGREVLASADFGIGALLVTSGAYLILLLTIASSMILVRGVNVYRRFRETPGFDIWAGVLLFNVIASLAWVLSMAHYTIALQDGGRHLFAFNLAIVVTAVARLRMQRKRAMLARRGHLPWAVGFPRSSPAAE